MATCQSPPQTVVAIPAIIALTPKPDAQASGRLAKMPMQMVMMPAPRQVAQASAPASMPAAREHRGVDGNDVGHCQERCQSSAKFGPDCGLALADVK